MSVNLSTVQAQFILKARYRRLAANAGQDQDELRRLNLAIELARKEFNQ